MDTIKYGFGFWKKYLHLAIIAQLCSFAAIICDLMIPLLSQLLIDYIIRNEEKPATGIFAFLLSGEYGKPRTFELFFSIAIWFGAFILIKVAMNYARNAIFTKCGLGMETDLREVNYKKLMELDSSTIVKYNTGELLQITNDTIAFKDFYCGMVPGLLDSVFVLIMTTYILTTIDITLLFIPVVLMPFFLIALNKFKKLARQNYQNIRKCNSHMNLTVQENIEAVRLVRSFTNEALEKKKFDAANEDLKDSHIKQIKLSAKFDVIFSSIRQIAYIGSIAVSAFLVVKGKILLGYLATCSGYVLRIMDRITQINNSIFQAQRQLVAGERYKSFMECESNIQEKSGAVKAPKNPNVRFENVSLTIEDTQVLKNVTIDIPYGKKLGIVGGTGSGKSVMLKSLVRINDVTKGAITIDGKDIRDYTLESLRDQFSYVFQEVFLFSNSVESNIAFARPDVDDEAIKRAAKNAQAHDFIKELTDGYKTIIGERGLGLSGGQKQRISIARALLKDAGVLIFDDSTSALDMNTEKKLLKTIKEDYPDKTVLISAHRFSSVVDCDEIIYLQDGEIVERGTFEELMKLNGHFAKVYNIQESQRRSAIDYDSIDREEV